MAELDLDHIFPTLKLSPRCSHFGDFSMLALKLIKDFANVLQETLQLTLKINALA